MTSLRPDYPEAYLLGILLWRQGDYFESHEVWEDLWNETVGRERDFYQGLIQAAVALCHYYNGNVRGALRLYSSSGAYLASFGPCHRGLDLVDFAERWDRLFDRLQGVDPDDPIPLNEAMVPRLDLDPPPVEWPDLAEWRSRDSEFPA